MTTGDPPRCKTCGAYIMGIVDVPSHDPYLHMCSPMRPVTTGLGTCDECGKRDSTCGRDDDLILRCEWCRKKRAWRQMDAYDLERILTEYLGDAVFARRFAGCMELIRRKNADYSQGEQKGDRIAAFRRIGRDIGVTMPQVWAIFAQKHWGAVMKYVKEGTVESEPISGRIDDLINYFVLLGAIIDDIGEDKEKA